jgi:hypothetical protein
VAIALLIPGLAPVAAAAVPAGTTTLEATIPADAEYRKALELVYDGAFPAAEARLGALADEHPDDPVGPYLRALALEWRLEQDPASRALDRDLDALADRALALADARLAQDPVDGRALMARGAAHGIKSRLRLFRWDKGPAAREAVRMREGLQGARAAGVEAADLDFGLGLYDYYAETLPRFFKLLRFLAGIPGGDRARGLAAIARVARGGSLFHDDEARVQMFEIQSYFEKKPDYALHWIREMWSRHPGWPLWGLKLAELLRDPLGLYGESAAVASSMIETAEQRRHANYQPVVAAMARVALAEALLGDLRLAEAREAALAACAGVPDAAWVGPRAELVVGRTLELEGDRGAAVAHYRRAAAGRDPLSTRRALDALAHAASPGAVRAAALLARARRAREGGDEAEAEATCLLAFQADPTNGEARLCVARASLREGRWVAARRIAREIAVAGSPAWLRPPARLVLAEALAREGDREDALVAYKEVWEEPYARPLLRQAAATAILRLAPRARLPDAPPLER